MGTTLSRGFITLLFLITGFSQVLLSQESYTVRDLQIQKVDSINGLSFQFITTRTLEAEQIFLRNIELADSLSYLEGKARSFKNLSLAYYYQGKYDLSTDFHFKALNLFEELGLYKEAALQYSGFGYSIKRRSLDDAEFYLRKGISISESYEDSAALVDSYNWYGVVKEFREQYDSALVYYERSYELKKILKDTLGFSYSLSNIAGIYFHQERFEEALENFEQAYKISADIKDSTAMATFLHNTSYIYLAQKKWREAINYLQSSLRLSLKVDYKDLSRASYTFLTDAYEAAGMLDSALHYQKIYVQFNDNLLQESNNQTVAELEVQFKTAQKEKELAVKNAALAQEQLKVRQRTLLVAGLGGFLFFGIVISMMIFRQQRAKQKNIARENTLKMQLATVEMENKIHHERERISRDLHDNVGAHITNLIAGIEIGNLHIKKNQNEKALGLLTSLDSNARFAMTELRETIWMLDKDEVLLHDFITHLKTYFHQQDTLDNLQITFHKEVPHSLKLNPQQSLHLLRIIQEALTNSRKYAEASTFSIKMKLQDQFLEVLLTDDGTGANENEITGKGNGLNNMKRRADELDGSFEIKTTARSGFSIKLRFPVGMQS